MNCIFRNIKLIVAYDGTRFLGWQKTSMGASVEETLEQVLQQILQEKISLQAASRTDAGVHALGQVVNFYTQSSSLELPKLLHSLNALLPNDLIVREISSVPLSFHPTLDSLGKEYHYSICFEQFQLPQTRHFSWHYPYALNIDIMQEAAKFFLGKHDFETFCNVKKNASYEHYERTIQSIIIDLVPMTKNLVIKIRGDHFLYKMVRNIVGTLVYVGRGKISVSDIPKILLSKSRPNAGMTAPAHGLSLHHVYYSE